VPGNTRKEVVIVKCITASGRIISGASEIHSLLFPNARVEKGDVVVEGNASLNRCIIDRNVRVPALETIGLDRAKDGKRFTISEKGIVVVPQGYRFRP
jgi:glucose-1-phosphate adenylyltransferase